MTVTFADEARGGALQQEKADWCLCTIPLSILSQIDIQVGAAMQAAINAVPYGSSIKVGLQFKRRFWEEDEHIYGGITYTDLPISRDLLSSTRYGASGPAVVLGAYVFDGPNSFEFTRDGAGRSASVAPWSMAARSIRNTPTSSTTASSVAWHRVPGNQGCYGKWTDALRDQHYNGPVPDGRSYCVGRRARLLYPRLAGRRHPFLTRRNPAPACARHRLMARAT